MFLAVKEIKRAKVRFGLLMAAIGLLVFLILFQQTLQDGLLRAFVGAIDNQSAPVLVYSVDGQRTLQGSIITPPLEAKINGAPGVGAHGRIGQGTFTVTVGAAQKSATIIGYQDPKLGAPTTVVAGRLPKTEGETVVGDELGAGWQIGDRVRVEPGGYDVTVVGRAKNISLFANPTMFTTYPTYERAVRAVNPDATVILPNVIGVAPTPGVSNAQLVKNVNAASLDADALTKQDAAAKTPGVAQVRQSFFLIFLLYALVVPFVTGLFFLILTFQKANALTLLRAIGAPSKRLVRALMVQVLIVMGVGLLIGVALYAPLSQQTIGAIPLRFETVPVIVWCTLLLVLGLVSALFSARRVLRIDPIEATTGAGVGS
ncbi:MAG: ABC transporter permease [Acidimicrobiia bacterium]